MVEFESRKDGQMSILSRYVLKQHAAPALAGLAIFYFVLSMDFLVDYLNLFIAKGVPGLSVLEAFEPGNRSLARVREIQVQR